MTTSQSVPEVLVSQVPEDGWLLDVRENDEWAAGHVPGATHIRLGELGQRTGEVPRDQTVYVICRSGQPAVMSQAAVSVRQRSQSGSGLSQAAVSVRQRSQSGSG
jgi:rhodanese-related sulfurtransferase